MVKKQHRRLLSRALVFAFSAICVGGSTWIGLRADDTEIYINQVPAAQTPNVLFSIDTSGSMDNSVPGGGQTRMEAVKDALSGLINDTSNLKAGLGRFHRELGGPIIFPVVNLDETPEFLDESVAVSSIDRSSDDAEQSSSFLDLLGQEVVLDSTALEMAQLNTPEGAAPVTVTYSPLQSSDDDEQGGGGASSLDSPDLDLGEVDAGVRFPGVEVPANAIILHAEIEFQATGEASSSNTDVDIVGHDVDDSPTFSESGSEAVSPRMSDSTDAQVVWSNIADVAAGDRFTTPNIRSIIQEVTNRDGWSPGNALSVLFDRERGQHTPASFDNGSFAAPLLRIQYVESGTVVERTVDRSSHDAAQDLNNTLVFTDEPQLDLMDSRFANSHVGLMFRDVTIPDDATVVWADITFTARDEIDDEPPDMEILGIEDSDLNGFGNSSNFISDLPRTDASVLWRGTFTPEDEEIFAPERAEPLRTANLAPLIEEIRADTGFQPGDRLGFVIKDADDSEPRADRSVCSFDGVRRVNGCREPISARPTLRLVYAFPTTAVSTSQQVGLRFNNIRVPQGAAIESARIEFTADAESTSAEEGTDPPALTIEIEDNTAPVTYSNASGEKIDDRTYGAARQWQPEPWTSIGETRQTPDIAALVESVTSLNDWCGGGSLAFRITGDDVTRIAQAFDKGGSGAPRLRIDYDADNLSAGEGCTTRQITVPVSDEDDDVEESASGGWIDFDSADLDIEDDYIVGLRFTGVDIPQGATITSTNLLLAADDPTPDSGTNNITISAQQHPNAPPFTSNNGDVSDRIASAPSITWNEDTEWVEGNTYSPQDDGIDLTPLIEDIIEGTVDDGGTTWASGNALVFTLASDAPGSRDRDAEVCCNQADPPAALEVFYEVRLGDLGQSGTETGRQALLGIIDDLSADGFTPPVDALYEAGAYFASEPVHFGRTRGAGERYDGNSVTSDGDLDAQILGHTDTELLFRAERSRLSHFATYTPQEAAIVRNGDCTQANPNDPDCATEHIANSAAATYVSPFENAEACERGFLVLLSDGIANRNSSRELIQGLTGNSSCSMDIPNIDSNGDPFLTGDGGFSLRDPSSDEMCGLEVADYLQANDFIDEPGNATDVRNNVRTFTIGFDLAGETSAVEFLKALAFVGNGGNLDDPEGVDGVRYGDGFFTADNAAQLQSVFETIVNEIIDDTSSFVAPGISVNAFNRLFNLDDIYFSLFRPDDNIAWLGNLKKFKLCTDQPGCEFGETIDKGGQPAVNDNPNDLDAFGTLKTSAEGFWSGAGDSAPEISEGGAGERIPTYTSRTVLINTSDGPVDPDPSGSVAVHGTAPHQVDLSADAGSAPADPDDFNELKSALLESNNCDSGNANVEDQNDCLNELIEWITGKRFPGDLPRDSDNENDGDRWAFGDPMHSRPLVLTYGKDDRDPADPDDDVPLSKIFVGTNDGGIRMINEGDGIEEWIFFPNSMLGMQSKLKENPNGAHEYGVDDTPTARLRDADDDGIVEPNDGDFVHIYFGLRRGGRQLFALNVTPDSVVGLDSQQTLNAGTGSEFQVSIGEKGRVAPEILWRIDGTEPEFQRLGQTWSTPRPVRVAGSGGPRSVLFFGGGYDTTTQDGTDNDGVSPDGGDSFTGPEGSALGNAIFMVDADTGERLWWASGSPDGNGDAADADVPAMNTSIAAPVTTLDINGDGLVDRLYAVDLRGQVFRADIAATSNPADGESKFSSSTVGVLARLGSKASNEARRKFFYAPEVARVRDASLLNESYELIGIVSGNRSEPQGKTVQDRAYGIRDFLTENPAVGLNSSNFPACDAAARASCPAAGEPLTHSELQDVTEKPEFVIRSDDGSGIESATDEALDALTESHGWFFDLEGDTFDDPTATTLSGEKGFATATVLDGKMFFTTFLPPEQTVDNQDACSAPEVLGTSRFYAVDFFTGAPAFDRNNDENFDKPERFKAVGSGPSADVVPAFLPGGVMLPVPTGAGAIGEDPEISSRVNKTFWLEER